VIASAGLVKPGGIAIGPDGALYVTTNSISAGGGQVVRIVP
jgi:glucose/arabinose dehydrogenase